MRSWNGVSERFESDFICFDGDANMVIHPGMSRAIGGLRTNLPTTLFQGGTQLSPEKCGRRRLEIKYGCRDSRMHEMTLELTADDLREIDGAASKITVHGDRYPEQLNRLVDR